MLRRHSAREVAAVQQPVFESSPALEGAPSLAETVDSVSLEAAAEERAATVAGLEQAAAVSSADSSALAHGPLTFLLLGAPRTTC